MTKTREQALQDLSDFLHEVGEITAHLTPRQAAERAWHPGGPSVGELTEQIAQIRGERATS